MHENETVMMKPGNFKWQCCILVSPEPVHTVSFMHDNLWTEDWQSAAWYHVLDYSTSFPSRAPWGPHTTDHLQVSEFFCFPPGLYLRDTWSTS